MGEMGGARRDGEWVLACMRRRMSLWDVKAVGQWLSGGLLDMIVQG
jgi:stress response protein SCP2